MDRGGGSGEACYYAILGIAKDASFSDVRSAYRQLAMVSVSEGTRISKQD